MSDSCPNCGYCKACGRSNGPTYHPWGVVPYYPYQPYWWGTVTVGTGIGLATTPNQNGITWTSQPTPISVASGAGQYGDHSYTTLT